MAGTAITNIYPNVFPCVLLYLNKKTETLGYQDADIPETIAMWKTQNPGAQLDATSGSLPQTQDTPG